MYFFVEQITVKKHRIICSVISKPDYFYTNENFINIILQDFPTLLKHKCKNNNGNFFSDVINNTSVAHLFEHLVIDLQTRKLLNKNESASQNESMNFLGTTQIIDKSKCVSQIEINYYDDCSAIECINKAQKIINYAFSTLENKHEN